MTLSPDETPASAITHDVRYRAIFESAVDFAIIASDRAGRITDWNTGAEHIFGWSAADMLGTPVDRFFTSEDRAMDRPAIEMRQALAEGSAGDERWHVRKDGSRFWAIGEMMPLRGEAGTPIGFLKILRDRTGRRKFAEALQGLGDRLANTESLEEMSFAAAEVLGHTLDTSSAGYGTMSSDEACFEMKQDWTAPDISSLAGQLKVEEYGSYYDQLRRGEAVAIADVRLDPRTSLTADALELVSARAFVNLPLIEHGRLVALFFVLNAQPRAWSAEDIAFIRNVAQRTRSAIERRRAEQSLRSLAASLERQVEERTRERDRIWQVSRDMLGVADAQGIWLSINPAWVHVLGWPAEQIIGRTSKWLVHPDDRMKTREEVADLAVGNTSVAFENRFQTSDGHFKLLNWTAVSAEGLIYCVGRDVTAEREREKTLRESMDFTRLALSAVGGVGVWTYDPPSGRFFCDAATSELYGLDAGEGAAGIKGEALLANVHPDDRRTLRATAAKGLLRKGDLEVEYRIRQPDGSTRWVLSRGRTYFDEAGKPARRAGIAIETTRQRQLEEQLRQSQKMEAVGQLTGGIAHDFNNLLMGISGSLEMLRARLAQGRTIDLDRYVTAAQGSAKRAAALTHRLLAFSRRQTLDPRPTKINHLVMGMEELIRRTIGPAIELEVVGAVGLWATLVDPPQLENALLNLCINARDAMPAGGKLTIETSNRWLDDRTARERDLPSGQYVSLCVSDNGIGMSPEVAARAFDPFFTTKPLGQGTGLGLSMLYGFVRQSGGQVRIYSEIGQGAMVCLYLPRLQGVDGEAEMPVELSEAPRAAQGGTVLVVDDEPTVRLLVTEVLEDLGYTAIEAADGAAGLRVLQSDARIDLLVTDVGLPGGMNGRQMADAARVTRPGLKVLFITGYAENAVLSHGHLDPGMHMLTKPFALEALASRIRDLIADIDL